MSTQFFSGLGEVYKAGTSQATQFDLLYILSAYDARGNLRWESIPLTTGQAANNNTGPTNRTQYSYDPANRVTETLAPNDAKATIERVVVSNARTGTNVDIPSQIDKAPSCHDNDAASACIETHMLFDDRGQPIETTIIDLGNQTLTGEAYLAEYHYDELGQLTKVVDGVGATFEYTYDNFGNRKTAKDPGLGDWEMVYDANFNLIQQTDAKSQVTTFTYDTLNRPTLKAVTGEPDTTYTYDELVPNRPEFVNIGQLTTVTRAVPTDDAYHQIRYDHDATGGIAREFNTVHVSGGTRQYQMNTDFRLDGTPFRWYLPDTPGGTGGDWTPSVTLDASNRIETFSGYISSTAFDPVWGRPTTITYASGATDNIIYHPRMGWMNETKPRDPGGSVFSANTIYARFADGRVSEVSTSENEGKYAFSYDNAGRLVTAQSLHSDQTEAAARTQTFTYDSGGRMRANSHLGTYVYNNNSPAHAPRRVDDAGGNQVLSYDANGNMTAGYDGKQMTYDGENRITEVTFNGVTTQYIYGADGARLKRIDDAGSANPTVTLTFGPVEIQNFGHTTDEVVATYPLSNIRLMHDASGSTHEVLHTDQLGSVRLITDAAGARVSRRTYEPFGEFAREDTWIATAPTEDKSFIGERLDRGAGLQYLNARYYDQGLGLFTSPDWFEVIQAGVGTNRFSYSFNDPVNNLDPSGNGALYQDIDGDGSNEYVGQTGYDGRSFHPAEGVGYFLSNSSKVAAFSLESGISLGTYASRAIKGDYSNGAVVIGWSGNVQFSTKEATATIPGHKGAKPGIGWGSVVLSVLSALTNEAPLEKYYYHYTDAKGIKSILGNTPMMILPSRNGFTYFSPLALPHKAVNRALFNGIEWYRERGSHVVMFNPYSILENGKLPDQSLTEGFGYKFRGPIRHGFEASFGRVGENPFN